MFVNFKCSKNLQTMHLPFQWSFVLAITIFLCDSLFSQKEKPKIYTFSTSSAFGIKDAKQFDDFVPFLPGPGKKSAVLIERQNVKSYMMPIRKIESNGNLLAYTMSTCLEYYINLDRNYKVNLSPDYISLNLSNTTKEIFPEHVFQFLAQEGTVSAAILPFGASSLTSGVYATDKYTINNYVHLFRPVTRPRQKIFETRKSLLKGHPIIVEIKADPNLPNATGQRFWEPTNGTQKTFPLIVVGYDEEKEAFEATGCWGRQWGENGYIWIHYEDFGTYVENGYVMVVK